MSSGSLARQASAHARRTIYWAVVGAAVLITLTIAVVLIINDASARAHDRLERARAAIDQVLLADERLTMSANMAAATGEERWIERYDANIPMIDAAIADAMALARPEVAARFRAETSEANDRLVVQERASFDAVRAGRRSAARAILDGPQYAADKKVLADGADRFSTALVRDVSAELESVQRMAAAVLPIFLLCVATAAFALWMGLSRSLSRSETEIEAAETQIRDLASTDALTGAANRAAFLERLEAAVRRVQRTRGKLALIKLDLVRFGSINEVHGHLVGDVVLKEVVRRISGVLRKSEFLARFGGDEFAIMQESTTDDCARRLGHSLVEVLCTPVRVGDIDIEVSPAVGLAIFPTVAQSASDLLRKVDVALYRAKEEERAAVRVYDLTMEIEISERMKLEEDVREAVAAGAFRPHLLPVVNMKTGEVAAFEILARWRCPKRGEVSPAKFLPVIDALGLINDLTICVLESACVDARAWPGDVTLSLNVSPAQIQDPWLVERLLKVLTKTGFPAQRLQVEVSETALVLDLAAAKRVTASLHNIGVKVALDDFGSGYSSLCYLTDLSFDAIKIDSSFVRAAPERAESAKVIAAIVTLSKSLGVAVCAEGVETEAQSEYLQSVGCDFAQGFFFAKPMPSAQAAMALVDLRHGQKAEGPQGRSQDSRNQDPGARAIA